MMVKVKKQTSDQGKEIRLERAEDESDGQALARAMLGMPLRHGHIAASFGTQMLSDKVERPGIMDCAAYVRDRAEKAATGDLSMASQMLAAQAVTLDTMFTAFAERAFNNSGHYPQTAERYGRLALKAQANARATLEALAKLHQPREQTVKHVHVNDGGQAVVADHFHAGGTENAVSAEQSHTTGPAGGSAALPSPHPLGSGMPIPSGSRQAPLQDARGD